MELLEAHKLQLGLVVVVQVEKKSFFFYHIWYFVTWSHWTVFWTRKIKGLSFRFCQLIKLNTCSQIISIRKARLYCHFDQVKTLLRDRFDQESKARVVPAQIVLQRRQFAQNMDSVSAVHIRWAGATVDRITSNRLFWKYDFQGWRTSLWSGSRRRWCWGRLRIQWPGLLLQVLSHILPEPPPFKSYDIFCLIPSQSSADCPYEAPVCSEHGYCQCASYQVQ